MKTKPPKAVEPEKLNAAVEDKPAYDPELYKKQWNNGHKFFLASEAKALTELLRTEKHVSENFVRVRTKMVKPRNPLNGDATPRDVDGEPVLNPKSFQRIVGGIPLFSEKDHSDSQEIARKYVQKGTVGKIGVSDSKYDVLGNKDAFGGSVSGQPEDLFALTKTSHAAKERAMEERAKINEYVLKEKAKRQQMDLTRELTILRQEAARKERELEFLRTHYDV